MCSKGAPQLLGRSPLGTARARVCLVQKPCCVSCCAEVRPGLRCSLLLRALRVPCCVACHAVLQYDAVWRKVPTHPSLTSFPGPLTKNQGLHLSPGCCLPHLTASPRPTHPHLRSFAQFCKQNRSPHATGPLHRLPSA